MADVSDAPIPDGLTIEELTAEEELERMPCQIHGLKARPELNGTRATSIRWDLVKQRMGVALADGTSIACKLANLRFGDDMTDEEPPSPPMPQANGQPMLYLSLVGDDCNALRLALQQRGLVHKVDVGPAGSKGPPAMTSATPEHIVACLGDAATTPRVAAQALALLAKVAPGQGKQALLSPSCNGATVATAALGAHAADRAVQVAGLELLVALARHDAKAVLDANCMRSVFIAMATHIGALEVQLIAVELLVGLSSESEDEHAGARSARAAGVSPAQLLGGSGNGAQLWGAVATCGGRSVLVEHVVAALGAFPDAAKLQAVGCRLLASIVASGRPGQESVCGAGGAAAAVRALCTPALRDVVEVRQWAMFALANLCSGPDTVKDAVGQAGACAAFAAVVDAYKARADVLRLAVGGLSHLASTEAGRQHVLGSPATTAVVTAMRAHASDVSVLDEACRFVAALAYGGPAGRRAALDAKADEMLGQAVSRFGGAPKYAEVVSMARTIIVQLRKDGEQGVVT